MVRHNLSSPWFDCSNFGSEIFQRKSLVERCLTPQFGQQSTGRSWVQLYQKNPRESRLDLIRFCCVHPHHPANQLLPRSNQSQRRRRRRTDRNTTFCPWTMFPKKQAVGFDWTEKRTMGPLLQPVAIRWRWLSRTCRVFSLIRRLRIRVLSLQRMCVMQLPPETTN